MKHDLKITFFLVGLFLAAQYVGLFITSEYITLEKQVDDISGKVSYNVTNVSELPLGIERIDVSQDYSWVYIMSAILIGTLIVLILVKFRQKRVWKGWYFFSLVFIMTFALGPFIGSLPAFITAIILSIFKTYKPNFIIHNLTEVFLYGGLAAMLVPIMNIYSAFILLIAISIYDAIAVWHSKHMITLAKFQSDSNVFAGLFIPYSSKNNKTKIVLSHSDKRLKQDDSKKIEEQKEKKTNHYENKYVKSKVTRAILGGGDIAFPLLFTGVIMKTVGFYKVLIMPPIIATALFALLAFSKKGKFYPAMPFISAGCFVAYMAVALMGMIF